MAVLVAGAPPSELHTRCCSWKLVYDVCVCIYNAYTVTVLLNQVLRCSNAFFLNRSPSLAGGLFPFRTNKKPTETSPPTTVEGPAGSVRRGSGLRTMISMAKEQWTDQMERFRFEGKRASLQIVWHG